MSKYFHIYLVGQCVGVIVLPLQFLGLLFCLHRFIYSTQGKLQESKDCFIKVKVALMLLKGLW